jgi:hypothetical protein
VEWGLRTIEPYSEAIAQTLSSLGRPLTYAQIRTSIRRKRPVNEPSLRLTLQANPRFYRSVDGKYGLRSWLLPREKQTLRWPDSHVEDRRSYLRLEKAVARGYDVEAMLQRDRAVFLARRWG